MSNKSAVETAYGVMREFSGRSTSDMPNKTNIIEVLENLKSIILPEFSAPLPEGEFRKKIDHTYDVLIIEIAKTVRSSGQDVSLIAKKITDILFSKIPEIRELVLRDAMAGYKGDPAAVDWKEVVITYPGFSAIFVHRISHELYLLGVAYIPRIMSEHAHSLTGVDIHPGATIGYDFFIDHGTGVVIGETTEIGNRVKIYQGVTLGALSLPTNEAGESIMRGKKRHPTIEDDSTIYAGATILGTATIGKGSVIGGNVWLIESVPANTKVMIPKPDLKIKNRGK